jgi:hypothetical protein
MPVFETMFIQTIRTWRWRAEIFRHLSENQFVELQALNPLEVRPDPIRKKDGEMKVFQTMLLKTKGEKTPAWVFQTISLKTSQCPESEVR